MTGAHEKIFKMPTEKMKIKVTILHHSMTIRTATTEMVTSPTAGKDSKLKSFLHCWWECSMLWLLWIELGSVL